MAGQQGTGYRQWRNRKQYASDIFEATEEKSEISQIDNASTPVLDEGTYGKSAFIPEFALPKHEATYATLGHDRSGSVTDEQYEHAKENVIAIRPDTRFMKEGMWPKALVESEEMKKNADEAIFRDFGVDIDRDTQMKQELMSDVPKATMFSDEKCWQIEEEWRKCKLMVRKGRAKASECKKLKSDMKMCRGLAAMSKLKDL